MNLYCIVLYCRSIRCFWTMWLTYRFLLQTGKRRIQQTGRKSTFCCWRRPVVDTCLVSCALCLACGKCLVSNLLSSEIWSSFGNSSDPVKATSVRTIELFFFPHSQFLCLGVLMCSGFPSRTKHWSVCKQSVLRPSRDWTHRKKLEQIKKY